MRNAIVLVAVLFIMSCESEPVVLDEEVIFQEMYDRLELGCEETEIKDYFKATINGVECCYYDGVGNMRKELSYRNVFVTSSPTLEIGGEAPKYLGNVIGFGITLDYGKGEKYQHWIEFITPLFDTGISKEEYLDSFFAITDHKIRGKYSKDGIKVLLGMWKKYPTQSGAGGVYSFHSDSGLQSEDSYLRFNKAEKISNAGITYYDIDMEVQCELFYLVNEGGIAQYGKEGLWSKLENGHLKIKVLL